MTTGTVFNRYKEQIRMAMKFSKIEVGEDENGPVYETVTKDKAIEEVMHIIDEMYYQLEQSVTGGRALENLIHQYVPDLDENKFLNDYMVEVEKERLKYNDYKYESDEFTAEYEKEIQRQRFTIIEGGKKD